MKEELQRYARWKPVRAVLFGVGMVAYALLIDAGGAPSWMLIFDTSTSGLVVYALLGSALGWMTGTERNDIAMLRVRGTITRDSDGLASDEIGATDAIEAIEAAADEGYKGLLVEVNSPGGEPTASEDIHTAIQSFDGPTVAVLQDTCASGGYLVASACDRIIARESSLVGSIGVIGSRLDASDLSDELGIDYEQFTAGEYKDAGAPLRETSDDEREYLQGLVDGYYDRFISLVSETRGLSPSEIRGTEARVFLGSDASDRGLVDECGTQEDGFDYLASELGEASDELTHGFCDPSGGLIGSPSTTMQRMAYAFGEGVASRIGIDATDSLTIKFK